ncbi:hypothetical protein M8818_006856 [Zalaria obscura]|uniref:Uncharacterized protein n=1 Tax=Zalaria obscura TaxID=2024903 RepID=A0ACC3S5N5_9PEZI
MVHSDQASWTTDRCWARKCSLLETLEIYKNRREVLSWSDTRTRQLALWLAGSSDPICCTFAQMISFRVLSLTNPPTLQLLPSDILIPEDTHDLASQRQGLLHVLCGEDILRYVNPPQGRGRTNPLRVIVDPDTA